MRRFARDLGVNHQTRILDVGGTPFNWELLDVRPRVTIVNMLPKSSVRTGSVAPLFIARDEEFRW